jgi:hypothetical protein
VVAPPLSPLVQQMPRGIVATKRRPRSIRPECFWYEPLDMLRKLALSGLLQFVKRGTAAQVLVGCVLAFSSFGLQLRLVPYREHGSNTLKATVDAQIFLTCTPHSYSIAYPVSTLQLPTAASNPATRALYTKRATERTE